MWTLAQDWLVLSQTLAQPINIHRGRRGLRQSRGTRKAASPATSRLARWIFASLRESPAAKSTAAASQVMPNSPRSNKIHYAFADTEALGAAWGQSAKMQTRMDV